MICPKVIKSGSEGNAVIYGRIMVDCGVSFSKIKDEVDNIDLILLTHNHNDHLNVKTLASIAKIRHSMRFGLCSFLYPFISNEIKDRQMDVYEIGEWYRYGKFKISPIKLYHDVPNCGYRINIEGEKIIHATDTATLEGIEAKGYDIYAIESNYSESNIDELIAKYPYKAEARETHLSEEQCNEFFMSNKKGGSKLIRLHQSKNNI